MNNNQLAQETLRYWSLAKKARNGKESPDMTESRISYFINSPMTITCPKLRHKLFQLREENRKRGNIKTKPSSA